MQLVRGTAMKTAHPCLCFKTETSFKQPGVVMALYEEETETRASFLNTYCMRYSILVPVNDLVKFSLYRSVSLALSLSWPEPHPGSASLPSQNV